MAAGGAAAAARAMGGSGARGRRVLCSSQTTAVCTRLRPRAECYSTCTASWSEHHARAACVWGVAALVVCSGDWW